MRNYQYKKFRVLIPNKDWTWKEVDQYDSLEEAVRIAAELGGAVWKAQECIADFSR